MKLEFVCMAEDSITNLAPHLDRCLYCRDMTIGCIDFVAKPMFEATAVLLPHLHDEALANLTLNRSLWSSFSMGGRRGSEAIHLLHILY